MSKRIQVMISDSMNERLYKYSERYGVSKSSIVGFVVGQWLDQIEQTNKVIYGVTGKDGFLADLFKEISEKSEQK
jgi:hypothetical protein